MFHSSHKIITFKRFSLLSVFFFTFASTLFASVAGNARFSSDTTYAKLKELNLDTINPGILSYFSSGYRDRALRVASMIVKTQSILRDSLSLETSLTLAVLSEDDWEEISNYPFGIHHITAEPPWIAIIPAETDKGAFFTGSEPMVDAIGLHYLAHFFAAEYLYDVGTKDDKPVKWLDEIATSIVGHILYRQGPADVQNSLENFLAQSLEATDLRIRTVEGYDKEYNRYFSTQEGAVNFRWFQANIDRKGKDLLEKHGFKVLTKIRSVIHNLETENLVHDQIIEALEDKDLKFRSWSQQLINSVE